MRKFVKDFALFKVRVVVCNFPCMVYFVYLIGLRYAHQIPKQVKASQRKEIASHRASTSYQCCCLVRDYRTHPVPLDWGSSLAQHLYSDKLRLPPSARWCQGIALYTSYLQGQGTNLLVDHRRGCLRYLHVKATVHYILGCGKLVNVDSDVVL